MQAAHAHMELTWPWGGQVATACTLFSLCSLAPACVPYRCPTLSLIGDLLEPEPVRRVLWAETYLWSVVGGGGKFSGTDNFVRNFPL